MTPWYRIILYLVSLPFDLVGWAAVLLLHAFWGESLQWETPPNGQGGPALVTHLRHDSWPTKTWYKRGDGTWGGTTLSPHAIFYGPGRVTDGVWRPIQEHEHRHSEQGEAAMLASFMFSLAIVATGHWLLALVVWFSGYKVMGIANWTTAVLRGESFYRGSHHEEAAYDRAEVYNDRGH